MDFLFSCESQPASRAAPFLNTYPILYPTLVLSVLPPQRGWRVEVYPTLIINVLSLRTGVEGAGLPYCILMTCVPSLKRRWRRTLLSFQVFYPPETGVEVHPTGA